MDKMTLPNGMEFFYYDTLTTKIVYPEIFIDHVYHQHGITLQDGDVIFDVGANMGMYSLYASKQAKNLQIYTFEPVPVIFEILEANLSTLSKLSHTVKNYNIGLSNEPKMAEINFLPNSSGESSFTPVDLDFKVFKIMENFNELIGKRRPKLRLMPKFLRKIWIRQRIKSHYYKKVKKIQCKLRTMSDIITENNIKTIHMLKIDAENHEDQVLKGIKREDWEKIQQIAMEVHTHIPRGANLLEELTQLLTEKGFTCYEGEENKQTLLGVYMLYARRE